MIRVATKNYFLQLKHFRSIASNESHLCVRCMDGESNLCRRVLRSLLDLNRARQMEECKVSRVR